MAVGLFFVFLEIARKLRFALVILRPQSSWMTREVYAVAVFYPAVLADLIWPHEVLHLIALPPQSVNATQAFNRSTGVSNASVLRGPSFIRTDVDRKSFEKDCQCACL